MSSHKMMMAQQQQHQSSSPPPQMMTSSSSSSTFCTTCRLSAGRGRGGRGSCVVDRTAIASSHIVASLLLLMFATTQVNSYALERRRYGEQNNNNGVLVDDPEELVYEEEEEDLGGPYVVNVVMDLSHQQMAPAAAEEYDGVQIQLEQQRQQKRGAIPAETVVKILPKQEHVCETVIRTDYRPLLGQGQNGTRIEIQQDEERQFRATFIECEDTKRGACNGIDHFLFTSECATLYEFQPAGIRVEGSGLPFKDGFVKVPITCQCRLRRKVGVSAPRSESLRQMVAENL